VKASFQVESIQRPAYLIPEQDEEIVLGLSRDHNFPVSSGPRKVMSDRTYVARQRTFQVLSAAKEHVGISDARKYIRSSLQSPKDSEHFIASGGRTELPWTALHSSDQMSCTAQPARDILSEYMLESQAIDKSIPLDQDRAMVRSMRAASERSHRENKKKFFGKFVHDEFDDFFNWVKKGGDHLDMPDGDGVTKPKS